MAKVYIYALINPLNEEIFYVGQSKDMVSRMSEHRNMYNQSQRLRDYVEALSVFGVYPEYMILDEIEGVKFLVNELEKCWIGSVLKRGCALLNVHHRWYKLMNPDKRREYVHELAYLAKFDEDAKELLEKKVNPDGIAPYYGQI